MRQAHEADLRWSKSAGVIRAERDRSAGLLASLASVKESSKTVFLEAGALSQLTCELIRHQSSLLEDLRKGNIQLEQMV